MVAKSVKCRSTVGLLPTCDFFFFITTLQVMSLQAGSISVLHSHHKIGGLHTSVYVV